MSAVVMWQRRLAEKAALDTLHFGYVGMFALFLNHRVQVESRLQRIQLKTQQYKQFYQQ